MHARLHIHSAAVLLLCILLRWTRFFCFLMAEVHSGMQCALRNIQVAKAAVTALVPAALGVLAALVATGQAITSAYSVACGVVAAAATLFWKVLAGWERGLTFTDYVHAEKD
jgi:hypothetical protein